MVYNIYKDVLTINKSYSKFYKYSASVSYINFSIVLGGAASQKKGG